MAMVLLPLSPPPHPPPAGGGFYEWQLDLGLRIKQELAEIYRYFTTRSPTSAVV